MLVLVLDILASVCAFLYLKNWLSWRKRNPGRSPYPPGPKGLPLLGNIFDMPGLDDLEKASQLKRQYGDLAFFNNMGKPYIFVNTHEAAYELFDKRGHIYSSRPHNTLIELGGWTLNMGSLFPYCDEHRRMRQYLHRFFGQPAVEDFCELQTQVTHRLLLGLLKEPDRFSDLIRHSAGEAIMMVAYGYEVSERNDSFIELADEGLRAVTEAEGFSIVNMIPYLRFLPEWTPGAGFHKFIKNSLKLSHELLYKPYEMTKERILDGTAKPSMTSKLIESNSTADGNTVDEHIIAISASIAYVAGADTTVSTLNTFILAMVLYPDVQRRGKEELDGVVGKDNLPTMKDRLNLPYINAICNEASRWQPVTPYSVAHSVEEDDVYNGHFIPAGTTMLANVWAMQRDPEEYPEPEKFIPERWIPSEGKRIPRDVKKTAFGFGRRICPGRHFAENSIFIAVASILAAFNIEKALDENGAPITPPLSFTASFIRHPEPFKCKITPRSIKTTSLIQQAVDSSN